MRVWGACAGVQRGRGRRVLRMHAVHTVARALVASQASRQGRSAGVDMERLASAEQAHRERRAGRGDPAYGGLPPPLPSRAPARGPGRENAAAVALRFRPCLVAPLPASTSGSYLAESRLRFRPCLVPPLPAVGVLPRPPFGSSGVCGIGSQAPDPCPRAPRERAMRDRAPAQSHTRRRPPHRHQGYDGDGGPRGRPAFCRPASAPPAAARTRRSRPRRTRTPGTR